MWPDGRFCDTTIFWRMLEPRVIPRSDLLPQGGPPTRPCAGCPKGPIRPLGCTPPRAFRSRCLRPHRLEIPMRFVHSCSACSSAPRRAPRKPLPAWLAHRPETAQGHGGLWAFQRLREPEQSRVHRLHGNAGRGLCPVLQGHDGEALKRQGITVSARGTLSLGGKQAFLMAGEQAAGEGSCANGCLPCGTRV